MEKIERYIYAVTRKLPAKQRSDIEKELRSLINDMLSEKIGDREAAEADLDAVLLELGDPDQLSDQYRTKSKFLIGPAYYDTYIFVLKIVAATILSGVTLAITISYFVTPPDSLLELLSSYFGNLIAAMFQGFALLTIIFALFEYFNITIKTSSKEKKWSPADLPQLPNKEIVIKPVGVIFALIFTILILIILNTADHLIGIYILSDDAVTEVIPLFNQEVFRSLLPLLNIMLVLGIIKEFLKLAIGKWTQNLALINLVINLVSFVLFVAFITGNNLWNEAFLNFWVDAGFIPDKDEVSVHLGRAIIGFIFVLALALFIDSVTNVIKAFKYKLA